MSSSALSTRTVSSSGSSSFQSATTSSRNPTTSATIKPPKQRSNTIKPNPLNTLRHVNTESNTQTSHSGSLFAQLHHLFPHHALFHVRLHIHQLSSVPLVTGEFGIRWKFRNVHSPKGFKGEPQRKGRSCRNGKGKRGVDAEEDDEDDDDEGDGDGNSGGGSGDVSPEDIHSGDGSVSIPSVIINEHPDSTSSTKSTKSSHSAPSVYTQSLASDTLHPSSFTESTLNPAHSHSSTASPEVYSPARGQTAYLPLKEHSVTWEQKVDVIVQMGVERDTRDLLPNELKLVILQRVITGDVDAPSNPRLGAVYLNLAEYVAAGRVTRRYLLRESKTNATLKLTIELEHVGGEQSYKAPPLPKGEILGGIGGLLENDVYRTRPRTLQLFGNEGIDNRWQRSRGEVPFEVEQLPSAVGPKTTELLIEALFNPVPTTSRKASPFTYYSPPETHRKREVFANGEGEGNAAAEAERVSLHSTSSEYTHAASGEGSVYSGYSHSSGHEFGERIGAEEKVRSWWGRRKDKSKSRPGTPASGRMIGR